jgi:sodium-dependent dicarboxylate transporter 2/3/5
LSELASNTAAATTIIPVAIGLAEAAGVSVVPPALGAAIGASFGFMLPVSTAPNAIVYSSGLVPSKEMLKAGIILDLVAFVIIVLCLWLTLPLMGLDVTPAGR